MACYIYLQATCLFLVFSFRRYLPLAGSDTLVFFADLLWRQIHFLNFFSFEDIDIRYRCLCFA
jgi:hypothetical protein